MKKVVFTLLFGMAFSLAMAQISVSDTPSDKGFPVADKNNATSVYYDESDFDGLGYSNSSLQLGNAKHDSGEGSFVEYDFHTSKTGEVTVYTYMLPLFAKDKAHGTSYGIQIDYLEYKTQSNDVKEYSEEWAGNVIGNSTINETKFVIDKPGKHTLKIFSVDPGMIVQKIIIDLGGLKESHVRTPSFVTSEAVLASENLVFNQKLTDAHAYNATILPFTRNAVAAMYFAPVFFNKRLARDQENHENYRRTTDAFEVATLALRTWDKTGDVRHFFVGEHVEGIQFRKGTK